MIDVCEGNGCVLKINCCDDVEFIVVVIEFVVVVEWKVVGAYFGVEIDRRRRCRVVFVFVFVFVVDGVVCVIGFFI